MEMGDDIIAVQTEAFDVAQMQQWLAQDHHSGAQVLFVGQVRDDGCSQQPLLALELEQYPAMTLLALQQLVQQARARFALNRVALIHRIGYLPVGEGIVLVALSSAHRADAFAANEFIMDHLKNDVPLWKKVHFADRSEWVAAKSSDQDALKRW